MPRSPFTILPSKEGRETILDRGTNGSSIEVERFGDSEQAGDVKGEGENSMGYPILFTCLLMTITAATADFLDANFGRERGAGTASTAVDGPPRPTREPLVRAVDLSIGESQTVTLADGKTATVKLLAVDERRDPIRSAVREAKVKVEVNGEAVTLVLGQLPVAGHGGRRPARLPDHRGLPLQ